MKHKPRVYQRYTLLVLTIIMAFSSVDGPALGLVLQNIKTDLRLSDTQLGILTGIAFAAFYSIAGVPIARWSDRGHRVKVIALCTTLWSLAVSLSGLARGYWQLLAARILVASGEAGCMPPAHALIATTYERAERPRAIAIYMLSAPLSALVSYWAAGWLNEMYGWRVMFLVLGLPGLALAILARLTLNEPRAATARPDWQLPAAPIIPTQSLLEVFKILWRTPTFRRLLYSFSVISFFGAGLAQWIPTFLIRTYDLKTGELGFWLTLIWGVGGMVGTYLSGQWATRWAAGNEPLQLKVISGACALAGVLWLLMDLSRHFASALVLMALAGLAFSVTSAPLFATLQAIVPEQMRATSVSLFYLCSNLVGGGLGPLAVGTLSDVLRHSVGNDSLRFALIVMCPGYLWCAWHLWQASHTVHQDVAAVAVSNRPSGVAGWTPQSKKACP